MVCKLSHRSSMQHQLLSVESILREEQWIFDEENNRCSRHPRVLDPQLVRVDDCCCGVIHSPSLVNRGNCAILGEPHRESLRSEALDFERTVLAALPPLPPKSVGKLSRARQAEPELHWVTRRSPVTRRPYSRDVWTLNRGSVITARCCSASRLLLALFMMISD